MPKGDREILKADLEDGYGKVANLLVEALILAKMNGIQKSICLFIIRRTYFWNRKFDEIKLQDFAEACDSTKSYISTQLKKLVEGKVIIRKNYAPGKTPEYGINTRVSEWRKGFINVEHLHKCITKGLYKCETEGFRKCERVNTDESIENTIGSEGSTYSITDNIQKNNTTTTNIANTMPKNETKEKNNPVARVDADSAKQDEDIIDKLNSVEEIKSPLQKIENHYREKVLQRTIVPPKDLEAILQIYEKGYPVDFIIQCIDFACERYKKNNNGKLNIKSFRYFIPVIEDEWEKQKLREAADKIDPKEPEVNLSKAKQKSKQNYSSNNKPKNRFHNFQQRHHKYSNEELEKILGIK